MLGQGVTRIAGWDTHGLPVEIEVEKALNINGKREIEAYGIERFNKLCRESVFKYKADWESLSDRIGYWLDYEHPYVTYTNNYIETVWWLLKRLYEKALLYRGHKILPYCPRCGTALSSHEVAQGYEDVEDPSVYVALELRGGVITNGEASRLEPPASRLLVWTTTPWTLVSNVALAVHPDLDYVEVKRRDRDEPTLILAEARLVGVFGADWEKRWDVVRRLRGKDMLGWRYRRPFDWLEYPAGREHEVVVAGDFVSAEDGSGIVHMAPAFGADDYAAGQKYN